LAAPVRCFSTHHDNRSPAKHKNQTPSFATKKKNQTIKTRQNTAMNQRYKNGETVVRWPAWTPGGIGRALIFWLLLHQGKSDKESSRAKVTNKPQDKK
jgi:hypothetical protein